MSEDEEENRRLDVLISDYEQAREDERSLVTIQGGVLSVAVTILAAIPLALHQTCRFQTNPATRQPTCIDTSPWLLASVPIIPFAVIAFLMSLGIVSIVRSYYTRALEVDLQTYALRPLKALGTLRPASYVGTLNEVTSFTRGSLTFRLIVLSIVGSVLVAFGGLTVYIAVELDPPQRIAMLLVYGTGAAVLMAEQVRIVFDGRGMFVGACERYLAARSAHPLPVIGSVAERTRSVAGYLVLPRPDDLVKVLLSPAILLVLASVVPGADVDVGRFLVLWATFELLVYQARYQWNDIRGLAEDRAHPERANKRRLPIASNREGQRAVVRVVWRTILARLALAVVLGALAGAGLQVAILTAAVVVNAVVYEFLRSHPGPVELNGRTSVRTVLTWIAVSPGYGLRTLVPVLALVGGLPVVVTILLVVGIAALGFMNVALIWALEGAAHCTGEPGTASWAAGPELLTKPHLLRLLQQTRARPRALLDASAPGYPGAEKKVLEPRPHPTAPWNVAGLLALGCSSSALLTAIGAGPAMIVGATVLLAAFWAVLVMTERTLLHGLTLVVAAATGVVWALSTGDVRAAVAVGLPAVLVGSIHVALRHASFRDFRTGGPRAVAMLGAVAIECARLATGRATWDQLHADPGAYGGDVVEESGRWDVTR